MPRVSQHPSFVNLDALKGAGIIAEMIASGITYVHTIIDGLDDQLLSAGALRLSQMFELANVSSMLGNLLAAGIANSSQGSFARNGPHKYPDLLSQTPYSKDIEIKVSLEKNNPKGHLAKPGYYLTCRYVLCDEQGHFVSGKENRGDVPWIWEIRFGWLKEEHFSVSNTEGDSGKTAVINSEGLKELAIIFCDLDRCPYGVRGVHRRQYSSLYSVPSDLPLFQD
jgi:hypothetical protein